MAYDWVMLQVKRGDGPTFKNGMIVDILDPDIPDNLDKIEQYSEHSKKVYQRVKWPKARLSEVLPCVDHDGSPPIKTLPVANFGEDFNSAKPIEVFDAVETPLPLEDKLQVAAVDKMAISSGSYTVGTAGDYTDFSPAHADMAATWTGDFVFTQISDITIGGNNVPDGASAGYSYRATSNSSHGGDPTVGWTRTYTGTQNACFAISVTGSAIVAEIDNLHLIRTGTPSTSAKRDIGMSTEVASTLTIHDVLINAGGMDYKPISYTDGDVRVDMYNVVIWDCAGVAYDANVAAAGWELTNCTFFNCGEAIDAGSDVATITNCLFLDCTATMTGATNATSVNCGTDLADIGAGTDTDQQVNLTTADEVESVDDTESTFLKLKVGATSAINGTTPGLAACTTGIRGNAIPGPGGTYSIGADESSTITAGTYTVGTSGDFPTFGGTNGAINNIGTLTGALTLTQISDITETAIATAAFNSGAYDFEITSDTPSQGDPTAGHLISVNVADQLFDLQISGAGTKKIHDLNIKSIVARASKVDFLLAGVAAGTYQIYNILDMADSQGIYAIQVNTATPILEVWNCILEDCNIGLFPSQHNASSKFENIILTGGGSVGGIYNNNRTITYRNITFNGLTVDVQVSTNSNSTLLNCATTKASAGGATNTDCQTSITIGDEYESTSNLSADYFKLKDAGVCYDNGVTVTISGNTSGIGGNARPGGDGSYSIGATEFASVTGGLAGKPGMYMYMDVDSLDLY